jgi:hypothetical protein
MRIYLPVPILPSKVRLSAAAVKPTHRNRYKLRGLGSHSTSYTREVPPCLRRVDEDFPGTSMPDLANATVDAERRLYGDSDADVVQQAFEDQGIL